MLICKHLRSKLSKPCAEIVFFHQAVPYLSAVTHWVCIAFTLDADFCLINSLSVSLTVSGWVILSLSLSPSLSDFLSLSPSLTRSFSFFFLLFFSSFLFFLSFFDFLLFLFFLFFRLSLSLEESSEEEEESLFDELSEESETKTQRNRWSKSNRKDGKVRESEMNEAERQRLNHLQIITRSTYHHVSFSCFSLSHSSPHPSSLSSLYLSSSMSLHLV